MGRKLVLGIDLNNLAYASFYSPEKINSKGTNINAITGFFHKLKMLIGILSPDNVFIANDISRVRTFRRKMYPPYKAHRKTPPENIVEQLTIIRLICNLLGYRCHNHDDYECDDILGMASRYCIHNDMDMTIVSSDQDFFQLISPEITVFNMTFKELIDEYWINERYGITPSQLIDVKGLIGDKSDNIPGCPGIGKQTGIELIQKWGSIDNLYENINYVRAQIANRLLQNRDLVLLSRLLGTIVTDPSRINMDKKSFIRGAVDKDEINGLVNELELFSLINVMKYSLIPPLK